MLASTGCGAGLAVATADLAAVHDTRGVICHLDDRRPRAYRHERASVPMPVPAPGGLALAATTQEG